MAISVGGTKEISSKTRGLVWVSALVTCDSSGDATSAHGMVDVNGTARTPELAFAVPMDGADHSTVTVTVTSTNVVIAGGGNAGKYLVVAIG